MESAPSWLTAAATLALVAVTWVYVLRTRDALDASRRSAAAAEEAATHAHKAAEASERMAGAAERGELLASMPLLSTTGSRRMVAKPETSELAILMDVKNAGPAVALNVTARIFADTQLPGPTVEVAGTLGPGNKQSVEVICPMEQPQKIDIHIRYQDRQGREYLAAKKEGFGWGYGLIRRPSGSGELLDWLIEPQPSAP